MGLCGVGGVGRRGSFVRVSSSRYVGCVLTRLPRRCGNGVDSSSVRCMLSLVYRCCTRGSLIRRSSTRRTAVTRRSVFGFVVTAVGGRGVMGLSNPVIRAVLSNRFRCNGGVNVCERWQSVLCFVLQCVVHCQVSIIEGGVHGSFPSGASCRERYVMGGFCQFVTRLFCRSIYALFVSRGGVGRHFHFIGPRVFRRVTRRKRDTMCLFNRCNG